MIETTVNPIPQVMLDECIRLHERVCPRQVLGLRMGLYAGTLLGLDVPRTDKHLFVFMETDGCGADGVSIATGCTVGHRTMRMVDYGKLAATFVDTRSGRAIRIVPREGVREVAVACVPDEKSRWHKQLAGYQAMPSSQLLSATEVELAVSLEAIISQPGKRTQCEQCSEEIMNGREVLQAGKVLCRACSGTAYFTISNKT